MARRLAGLLLAVLALVGCNGGSKADDPPDSPSPSSSPSESESPTPVEPEMPDAAKQPDVAGAKAFTVHFWAMVDYAEATGDTKGLRKLIGPCEFCEAAADGLDEMGRGGGRITGGPRQVRDIKVGVVESKIHDHLAADVRFELLTPRQEEFYGPGDKRNKVYPESRSRFAFIVTWVAQSRWEVTLWEDD